MATVEIMCPHCEQNLKVPDTVFGKKVKCRHCELAFVVEEPKAKAKPSKPAAKPAAKAAEPPAPKKKARIKAEVVESAKSPFLDDDDEGAKKVELIKEVDVARCPHCAKAVSYTHLPSPRD